MPLGDISNQKDNKRQSFYVHDKMHNMTESIALSNLAMTPKEVWLEVYREMNKKSKSWSGMTNNQVHNLVNNTRRKMTGGDSIRKLEMPDMIKVQGSQFFFLQFNVLITDNTDKRLIESLVLGILVF